MFLDFSFVLSGGGGLHHIKQLKAILLWKEFIHLCHIPVQRLAQHISASIAHCINFAAHQAECRFWSSLFQQLYRCQSAKHQHMVPGYLQV